MSGNAQEDIRIPMMIESPSGSNFVELSASVYKPEGEGPFPLIVINHGTPRNPDSRKKRVDFSLQGIEFVKRGFVVVVPMRRGFGDSGGDYSESHGKCSNPDYYSSGMEASMDIMATVEFMAKQPYVDPTRILIVGQSAGGFSSLAFGSLNVKGIVGIINFAGGRGSLKDKSGVCSPDNLISATGEFGKNSEVPTLWIYTENDSYFSPSLARDMFDSYIRNGGKGEFVVLPPFRNDGHPMFKTKEGIPIWTPLVDEFINGLKILKRT